MFNTLTQRSLFHHKFQKQFHHIHIFDISSLILKICRKVVKLTLRTEVLQGCLCNLQLKDLIYDILLLNLSFTV